MKRPAFQFYPADWRKDAALQSCSLAAQGLWVNMLCIAHECDPYGHLVINGKPMNAAQIGRLVGVGPGECGSLLDELLDAGVVSMADDGAFFSRRMVRDEEIRNRRAAGGEKGAEHGAKGADYGRQGGRPPEAKGPQEPPFEIVCTPPKEPPPSSSSSSSSSEEIHPPTTSGPPAGAGIDSREPRAEVLTAADLEAEGVARAVAMDWLRVRKAKRSPLTRTAWEGVKREAAAASMSPEEAVRTATERGWQGFKAAWLHDASSGRNATSDVFAGAA